MRVTVRGDGVAAHCCARLLAQGGLTVTLHAPPRPKLPALMIGAATQALFRDAFNQPDLFAALPHIAARIVAWGPGAEPGILPHSAVVVSEQHLLDRVSAHSASDPPPSDDTWTVLTSRPLPAGTVEKHFGSRTARAMPVRLRPDADPAACGIESLSRGWLFLIPVDPASAWLLAVGDLDPSPLAESRVVSRRIAEITGAAAEFPSHPRISWPLCGPNWLACGTGALAFDPLCGDGTGNAIREAILAAAVLRRLAQGDDPAPLLAHYTARLLAGFHRHLTLAETFYRTGGLTPWWTTQLEAVRQGIQWSAQELSQSPTPQYQLQDFELIPRTDPPQTQHPPQTGD